MTDVIWAVNLNKETVWIIKLKRFFRSRAIGLQVEFLQSCAHLISVERRYSKIIVIEPGGLTWALLDAKKGVPNAQNMGRCRLLPERHFKKLLIKVGGAMKIGNSYRDEDHADRTEPFLIMRRFRGSRQRRKGNSKLPARAVGR